MRRESVFRWFLIYQTSTSDWGWSYRNKTFWLMASHHLGHIYLQFILIISTLILIQISTFDYVEVEIFANRIQLSRHKLIEVKI